MENTAGHSDNTLNSNYLSRTNFSLHEGGKVGDISAVTTKHYLWVGQFQP